MPTLGAPASVEVLPQFAAGLHRLEKHTHLWVLAWLDQVSRETLQVTPRGVSDRGPEGLHGVFAVRSPVRPNPIGLSVARVVRREALVIEFDRLDFVDGTPIVDLKPYFVTRDLVFTARNEQIGRPADLEALRESLRLQALLFHGETCADLETAVGILTHFRGGPLGMVDPYDWRITAPLSRTHLIDALMGMTRCTPGRGDMKWTLAAEVCIHHGGREYHYELPAEGGFRYAGCQNA